MYERLAGGRRAGFKELMLTQLVNALWHGIAPRYLTFFVLSVFFFQFSSVITRFEGLMPQALVKSYPWRGLKVGLLLIRVRSASRFLCMQATQIVVAA